MQLLLPKLMMLTLPTKKESLRSVAYAPIDISGKGQKNQAPAVAFLRKSMETEGVKLGLVKLSDSLAGTT